MSDSTVLHDESRSASLKGETETDYEGKLAAAGGDIESARQESNDEKLEIEESDPYLVEWNGADDPGNPLNFKMGRKVIIMAMIAAIAFLTHDPSLNERN